MPRRSSESGNASPIAAPHAQAEDIPDIAGTQVPPRLELPLRQAREAFERAYFEQLLARGSVSLTRLAQKSGLGRTHLYRKLKVLGIKVGKKNESP